MTLPLNGWPIPISQHSSWTQIEKLEDVAETLEELWLSYNLITSLDGLGGLSKLTTLYMSNNQIKAWAELEKLVIMHLAFLPGLAGWIGRLFSR